MRIACGWAEDQVDSWIRRNEDGSGDYVLWVFEDEETGAAVGMSVSRKEPERALEALSRTILWGERLILSC
jgi:hypothetical protein